MTSSIFRSNMKQKRLSKEEVSKAIGYRAGLPARVVTAVLDNYRAYSKYMVHNSRHFSFLGAVLFTNNNAPEGGYTTFGKQAGIIADETGYDRLKVVSVLMEYRDFYLENIRQGVPFTEFGLVMAQPGTASGISLRKSNALEEGIRVSLVPWLKELQKRDYK